MTIDVMFPYYGDVKMMKAAVQSVLDQEYRDFVLTIVDDGFPDDSLPAYFKALTDADDRVRYFKNETNLGANANYRKCLSLIEHDYVVIMGADDLMLPNYLSVVHEGFAGQDVDIIQPGVDVIDENGTVYEPMGDRVKSYLRRRLVGESASAVVKGEPLAASLLTGDWLYFPSLAWRSDAIKRHSFREQYDVVQDLALATDIIMSGGKMLVLAETCFLYRRHRESDSSVRALDGRRFAEERAFFDECVKDFRKLGWERAATAASRHASSRLHALTLLPQVARRRMWGGMRKLTAHALTR
ncbi:glycosyltransferase family 2 protein [Arthrobacter pityocampae]|uniref:glycosyltransferase family 2 protein n=1 Tax=Arthrobacter pityocampae TaxID=547334 RepID=UPI0037362788